MFSTVQVRTVRAGLLALLVTVAAGSAAAQTPLTLKDAMTRAQTRTPEARALVAVTEEAAARVRQARGGYFPRIDVTESVQRGDEPVFVFSSLLSQRQFTAANFDITSLNHPAPITNVRTGVSLEQSLFDARTGLGVRAAELDRDLAALDRTRGTQDLALAAAQAFVHVLQLEAAGRATDAAVAAAESDLDRARARRDAGVVTEADVLAVQVHLADVQQRQMATRGDVAVARMQLNDTLGLPLDQSVMLVTPPSPAATPDADALVQEALRVRPEYQQVRLRVKLAENGSETARAAFLPTVGVQGGWDFNGSTLADQRAGWIVGAQVRLNVFNGFADAARLSEAREARARASAEQEQQTRRIEVDVRSAIARLDAARARDAAGRAALAQAAESQRIIRDRYDTGLATITDVLRAAEAALDAESRAIGAQMDVILQSVTLDRAVGRL